MIIHKELVLIQFLACSLSFLTVNAMETEQEILDRELLRSIEAKKSIEIIQGLINQGAKIDAKDSLSGASPLLVASERGLLDICVLLIEKGADVNACNDRAITPLCAAAAAGHIKVCAILIEKKAPVNPGTHCDPLCWAASAGHIEICTLLINNGATINPLNERSLSPLGAAAFAGHINVVILLLGKGAKVNVTHLRLAAQSGQYEICELLIRDITVNEINSSYPADDPPLNKAAAFGHTKLCTLLIDNGALVNQRNNKSPLLNAAEGGHTDTCRLLIEREADVNAKDNKGETPLHKAAKSGCTDTCNLLILSHANVNAQNNKNFTPLFYVTDNYRHEERGRLNEDICILLIQNGSLVNLNGKNVPANLCWAIDNKLFKICKLLIEKGANVNEMNEEGSFPLHQAVIQGNTEICQLLLQQGALINGARKDGKIPLIVGAQRGHTSVCRILQREMVLNALKNNIDLATSRSRFQTVLKIFRRLLAGNYKNLGFKILTSSWELEKELLSILYYAHYKGIALDDSHKILLQKSFLTMLEHTGFLEPIKIMMKEAVAKNPRNKNLANILHPNSIEESVKQLLSGNT